MGFLQLSHTLQVLVNFWGRQESHRTVVYDDYVKDLYNKEKGFQSYSDYISHLIDKTIDQIDKNIANQAIKGQTVMCNAEFTAVRHHNTSINIASNLMRLLTSSFEIFMIQIRLGVLFLMNPWTLSLLARIGNPPLVLP